MSTESIICCVQDVHTRELVDRIGWAVRLRWFFVVACFVAAGFAALPMAPLNLEPGYFLAVGGVLLFANLFYRWQAHQAKVRCPGTGDLRRLCLLQVMGDYMALAVVAYALGTVETPVLFLVLPNIIVVALFFTPRQGLAVTVTALLMVTSPLLLETVGVLPERVLFASPLKRLLLDQPLALAAFLGVLVACVLVCWYLVSVITERLVHNELELEQSYEQMVRLDEERTRAVLRGTHELKAPLAAIKSYVFTLRDGYGGELPDKAQKIVERIGRRCDRLLAKITDIMRLSNLRTYVYTGTQFENVDLLEVMSQFVNEAEELGRTRNVTIGLENRIDGSALVRATREHLHTLFSNLLANAVQYSHDGEQVMVRLLTAEKRIVVEVEDHGIGVPPDARQSIFDEFYRARNAAAHHEGGTGLGLPIVKATARVLGATVEVLDAHPQGSVFRVTLPTG
ncbi:MAG: sensor histidine kinase [Proteobacteria bacterium]|nr:MAG: sensor histidine kinase [Pseudomonadota bacterium]